MPSLLSVVIGTANAVPSQTVKGSFEESPLTLAPTSQANDGKGLGEAEPRREAVFSLYLDHLATETRVASPERDSQDTLTSSPQLLFPENTVEQAYELLPLDGNNLPFFGQELPSSPFKSSEQQGELALAESPTGTPQTQQEDILESIQSDIAAWLDDPELGFSELNSRSEETKSENHIPTGALALAEGARLSQTSEVQTRGQGDGSELLLSDMEKNDQDKASQGFLRSSLIQNEDKSQRAAVLSQEGVDLAERVKPTVSMREELKESMQRSAQGSRAQSTGLDIQSNLSTRDSISLSPEMDLGISTNRLATQGSSIAATGSVISSPGGTEALATAAAPSENSSTSNQITAALALEQWKLDQKEQLTSSSELSSGKTHGEGRVTVPFNQTSWGESLGRQLSILIGRNFDSAQIQLDPPELGPLQVKIQINNEQVSLQFTSAHTTVRDALESSAQRLQELFEAEGLELIGMDVADKHGDRQSTSNDDNRKDSMAAQSGETDEEGDDILTVSRSISVDEGKIDYFI